MRSRNIVADILLRRIEPKSREASSPLLECSRRDGQHDDQARDNKSTGDQGNQNDSAARSWELAANHVVLALEVAMEAE